MHEPVKGRLEDYLHGKKSPEVDEHLKACEGCRKEVERMRRQSELFRSMQAAPRRELSPAFYARVMERVESQARPSVWSVFGDSLFAKRLAYASMTFMVVMGSFIVSMESGSDNISSTAPEVIFASDEEPIPVETDPQRGRETVLVTLTSYQGF